VFYQEKESLDAVLVAKVTTKDLKRFEELCKKFNTTKSKLLRQIILAAIRANLIED
jgi:hypothetical protein